jgi:RimJ/RimL family protein N-acetyltransferase
VKIPAITTDDYIIYTENVNGLLFVHMDVFKWTKSIKKEFSKDWLDWARKQKQDIYAMPLIDNEKMVKWAVITGFKVLENHKCLDGISRKLYLWRENYG